MRGTIQKVRFYDESQEFAIVELGNNVTAKGPFRQPRVGDVYEYDGEVEEHPRWGRQVMVTSAQRVLPMEQRAVEDYLVALGTARRDASRIVATLGAGCLADMASSDVDLPPVPNIDPEVFERIRSWLRANRRFETSWILLRKAGLSPTQIAAAHEQYGDGLERVIKHNPYLMCYDVHGIGFVTADRVALESGVKPDDQRRIEAAIHYVLYNAGYSNGHTWVNGDDVASSAHDLIQGSGFVPDHAEDRIREILKSATSVESDGPDVSLKHLSLSERRIASCVADLLETPLEPVEIDTSDSAITYSGEQISAIRCMLSSRISVLTGGAGTGKSTVLRAVVDSWASEHGSGRVFLAAPTGKAAKRMAEVTGYPATTIHRLLDYGPTFGGFGFRFNERCQLPKGLVVIDESSMLTVPLAAALFEALPVESQLVLVGDINQLPPIGPGNVLKDLIDSRCVPVSCLTTIFRQRAGSGIALAGESVIRGEMPDFVGDCERIGIEDVITGRSILKQWVKTQKDDGVSLLDWQVIAPKKDGDWGVNALNLFLQKLWNPESPGRDEHVVGKRIFRVGDKVMQTENNYELDVFNGDLGVIERIERKHGSPPVCIVVRMGDRDVHYAGSSIRELMHAYACTVHKYQGSQAERICVVLSIEADRMLSRNLLYTALTRAQTHCLLLAGLKTTGRAVSRGLPARNTRLRTFVEQECHRRHGESQGLPWRKMSGAS